ncbi:hypothetical protein OGAPHI_001722 [Ogataea philodendri]|uniref:Uncharacterized protein n=1 Tax=Ogataea philodendri TaxID=1378263 RepID=A0A9P8T6D2_9ASCO|nr:uncharacterized protein OGAPHI_001722 [Ogataea philodendri]KAH3667968.1 hypothetical protein OGAPHI_001722 [Ogataea philodendri]
MIDSTMLVIGRLFFSGKRFFKPEINEPKPSVNLDEPSVRPISLDDRLLKRAPLLLLLADVSLLKYASLKFIDESLVISLICLICLREVRSQLRSARIFSHSSANDFGRSEVNVNMMYVRSLSSWLSVLVLVFKSSKNRFWVAGFPTFCSTSKNASRFLESSSLISSDKTVMCISMMFFR